MKVILLRDVAKLGRRHTVVTVPDGYAQNKLIPQGMATPATPQKIKQLSAEVAGVTAANAAATDAFKSAVAELEGKTISITRDANAQGHLFVALKPAEVHAALVENGITAIPSSAILIPTPIKSCGTHELAVVLHDATGHVAVTIIPK
jgi:large subunit ribosomal protein L9